MQQKNSKYGSGVSSTGAVFKITQLNLAENIIWYLRDLGVAGLQPEQFSKNIPSAS